jgi:hypothetical protein
MAAPAVIAIAILAALTIVTSIAVLAASGLVVRQVRREEQRFRREGRRLTLTRPAPSGWALLARSICGVYICGMEHEALENADAEEEPPWYERSGGPSWR